jgi:peptidoglycan/LPS O-acetylase OafA/YrhL
MEGLRGFSVFLVFLIHYVTLIKPWVIANPRLLEFSITPGAIGNTGIGLFFVLSSYLIYGSLFVRYQPFLNFIGRRIQRIYPAFIAVFVIYIFLPLAFPAENKIPSEVLNGAIYLVQNRFLLPGLLPIQPMLTLAWSLSYGMFFCLITLFIIGLPGLRKRSSSWRIFFFAAVAAAFSAFCAIIGSPVRLIRFVSGILVYQAVSNKQGSTPPVR